MAMSEKFKAMSDNQKCVFVGKVKRLYDVGVTAEEISTGLNKDLDLVREAIDLIEAART